MAFEKPSPGGEPSSEVYAKKYARNGWKESARALAVAAGLMGGAAEAATPSDEQIEHAGEEKKSDQVYEYNEAGLSAYGKWVDTLMNTLEEETNKIPSLKMDDEQKHEVAQSVGMSIYKSFIREFYFPTKGEVTEGSYGVKERKYSEDDLKLLKNTVTELRRRLQGLDQKYGTRLYTEQARDQLDDMDKKIDRHIQRLALERAQEAAE